MDTNRQPLSVNIPSDLMAKLQREADALGITVHQHASAIVFWYLRESIKREGER